MENSILCVDDDHDNLELLEIMLGEAGFEVKTCDSLETCLPLVNENRFSAVVLDNRFGSETSLEVCREIRRIRSSVPIVIFTADARLSTREEFLSAGADAFLVKPDDLDKIVETMRRLIGHRE